MPNFEFDFNLSAVATGALKVLLVVVLAYVLIRILGKIVPKIIAARVRKVRDDEQPEELASRSKTLSGVVTRFCTIAIWIIAALMILGMVGVDIGPVLAAAGLAGLAIGLAAQNIIRDYFNGFFIVMEDWFRIGEVATVAGITGIVTDMSLRYTVLRDLSGIMHIVPNSKIELTSNWTRDWSRINLNVTVAYKERLDDVISVINEECEKLKEDADWGADLLSIPQVLRVDDLGNHGVDIKILGDTKPMRQWALMGELRKRLKNRFDEEGIEIPWPHSKVYFGNSLKQEGETQ